MKVFGHKYFCFFLCSIFLNALSGILSAQQELPVTKVGTVEIQLFTTDFSGNIYTWNVQQEFTKYNAAGEKLFRNNFSMPGTPASIDARNPMLTLLYYPDFLKVRMVDRTLSQLAEINLGDFGYMDIPCIAASNDNQMWVYDQSSNRILKLNMQGQVLTSSPDLRQWTGLPLNPVKLKERNNKLFLLDKTQGLLILDLFAQPEDLISEYHIIDFQLHDGNLYLLHDKADRQGGQKMLSKISIQTRLASPFKSEISMEEISQFRVEKGHFYVLKAGKVWVYAR